MDISGSSAHELSVPEWVPASVAREARRIRAGMLADGVPIDEVGHFVRLVADDRMKPAWRRLERLVDPAALSAVSRYAFGICGLSRVHTPAELQEMWRSAWQMAKQLREDAASIEVTFPEEAATLHRAAAVYVEKADAFAEANQDQRMIVDRQRTDPHVRGFVIELTLAMNGIFKKPLADVVAAFANTAFDLRDRDLLNARQVAELTKRPRTKRVKAKKTSA